MRELEERVSTFYWMRVTLRNLGACILLFLAWRHSHWSVALLISLLYLAEELRSIPEELEKRSDEILRCAIAIGAISPNEARQIKGSL
jgi:hypothetical protein